MLRTLILTIAALAATLTLTPTAQASGCADYIKVCARPGATSTGGGGDSPFYAELRDPVTHQVVTNPANGKPIKTCRSGCDGVDRTLNN